MALTKLTIGFMPLLDCAPLVAAAEQGFARDEGIELILVRETSWANIRDRLIIGHFDAAHMLGPMAVASALGIAHVPVPLIAPCALGLGGNAVTVSMPLYRDIAAQGALPGSDPRQLGEALRAVIQRRSSKRSGPLTFGIVFPFSCHNYELRYWLNACGIDPDRDVRLVVIPPPFLVDALRNGQIDGFCVGEPWNSVAVQSGVGAILAPTTAIWRASPEKVLGCREALALEQPEILDALVRAVYHAAGWCDERSHHAELSQLLAAPRYVGVAETLLQAGLGNRLAFVVDEAPKVIDDFYVLRRHHALFPWISHAIWFYSQMVRWQQTPFLRQHLPAVRATFRPDLYRRALAQVEKNLPQFDMKIESSANSSLSDAGVSGGFFDARVFDPHRLESYLSER
jgi:ABC-type nitrate/sulfonate/bicarbonate transport system substrate-binding protein